jgi:hypothetical protein
LKVTDLYPPAFNQDTALSNLAIGAASSPSKPTYTLPSTSLNSLPCTMLKDPDIDQMQGFRRPLNGWWSLSRLFSVMSWLFLSGF